MRYEHYQPDAPPGKIDRHLPKIARELADLISEAQKEFSYDSLCLDRAAVEDLACVLVDFAADVHAGSGIWLAYERYNREFFGASLPITGDAGVELHPRGIGSDRVGHLLWMIYPELIADLVLGPVHRDLLLLTGLLTPFLRSRFARLPSSHAGLRPTSSCVKSFLGGPNDFGWEVKRKLIWLGTKSFMFRLPFRRYIAEECGGERSIGHIDDFICQECTPWSGLGAIDVLAAALDISDEDRQCLRGWYERHAAAYKVLTADADVMETLNVYSEERYLIRMNTKKPMFRAGQLVLGSLVPWRGEWYWSGKQRVIDDPTPDLIEDLKATMKRRSPRILCRYWKGYEKKVRERAQALYARSLEYHGKELVAYPDGLAMAADWQKEFRHYLDSLPKENVAEAIERHGLRKNGLPEMSIPGELLSEKDGAGVYLNPNEGKEIMPGFNPILAGFRRKGEDLSEDEAEAVRGFVLSEAVSPRFVKVLVDEHGDDSIRTAFMLKGNRESYCLDYLLRRYKGHFYRRRYPSLSVV